MIEVSEVEKSIHQMVNIAKAEFLELPGLVCETLRGKDPGTIETALDRAIRKILRRLSLPDRDIRRVSGVRHYT